MFSMTPLASRPRATSHTRTVWSVDAQAICVPLGHHAHECAMPPCPSSVATSLHCRKLKLKAKLRQIEKQFIIFQFQALSSRHHSASDKHGHSS